MISGHCEADFIISLDASGSISEDDWGYAVSMTRTLVNVIHEASELGKTSRLGMFRFSGEIANQLLDLAEKGIGELIVAQQQALQGE